MSSDKLALLDKSSVLSQVKQNREISLETIERIASHFSKSNLYGLGDAALSQCVIKMLAGKEIGIPPFMAVKEIYLIPSKAGNRFSYSANLISILIKQHPLYDYKIVKLTNTECSIDFFENGELVGNETFTLEDAKRAKLDDKDTYKQFPKNMLRARALTNGAQFYCPLIYTGSMQPAEENPTEVNQGFIDIQVEQINNTEVLKHLENIDKMLIELGVEPQPYSHNLDTVQLSKILEYKLELAKQILKTKILELDKSAIGKELDKLDVVALYLFYQELITR